MYSLLVLMVFGIESLYCGRVPSGPPRQEIVIIFESGFISCEGYENKIVLADKIYAERVNRTVWGLAGDVEVTQDLEGPLRFTVIIFQQVNSNWEFFCEIEEDNLCQSFVEDTGKPWSPYVLQLKINGCPVRKGTYKFTSTALKGLLPFPLENMLYRGEIRLFQNDVQLGCHLLNIKTEVLEIR